MFDVRRSPRPCCPDCKGWDIFNEEEGAPVIQRCDECWQGIPDAPPDAYYQISPVCVLALDAATLRANGEAPAIEECEDNACAGCAWCDATPADDCREWDDGTMGGRDQFEGES